MYIHGHIHTYQQLTLTPGTTPSCLVFTFNVSLFSVLSQRIDSRHIPSWLQLKHSLSPKVNKVMFILTLWEGGALDSIGLVMIATSSSSWRKPELIHNKYITSPTNTEGWAKDTQTCSCDPMPSIEKQGSHLLSTLYMQTETVRHMHPTLC